MPTARSGANGSRWPRSARSRSAVYCSRHQPRSASTTTSCERLTASYVPLPTSPSTNHAYPALWKPHLEALSVVRWARGGCEAEPLRPTDEPRETQHPPRRRLPGLRVAIPAPRARGRLPGHHRGRFQGMFAPFLLMNLLTRAACSSMAMKRNRQPGPDTGRECVHGTRYRRCGLACVSARWLHWLVGWLVGRSDK
jgi:hypothetical protein